MARILVIDDDNRLRQLLCRVLQNHGSFEVFEADNGSDGLLLMDTESVDLVITDIFMPQEDGIGTIMEICENHPKTKIMAISGGGNVEDVDFLHLASCLGAQKVLQKPFGTDLFLSTVEDLLN